MAYSASLHVDDAYRVVVGPSRSGRRAGQPQREASRDQTVIPASQRHGARRRTDGAPPVAATLPPPHLQPGGDVHASTGSVPMASRSARPPVRQAHLAKPVVDARRRHADDRAASSRPVFQQLVCNQRHSDGAVVVLAPIVVRRGFPDRRFSQPDVAQLVDELGVIGEVQQPIPQQPVQEQSQPADRRRRERERLAADAGRPHQLGQRRRLIRVVDQPRAAVPRTWRRCARRPRPCRPATAWSRPTRPSGRGRSRRSGPPSPGDPRSPRPSGRRSARCRRRSRPLARQFADRAVDRVAVLRAGPPHRGGARSTRGLGPLGLLFPGDDGGLWRRQAAAHRLARIVGRAGLEASISWHNLRDSAATNMLRDGDNPTFVAKVIGNSVSGAAGLLRRGAARGRRRRPQVARSNHGASRRIVMCTDCARRDVVGRRAAASHLLSDHLRPMTVSRPVSGILWPPFGGR